MSEKSIFSRLRGKRPRPRIVGAWLLCFGWMLLAACRADEPAGLSDTDAASLLRIERTDSFARVDVLDAWNAGKVLQTYVLVPRSRPLPETLPAGQLLRTPLRRAVVFSSVHASLLYDLGCQRQILGLCDAAHVRRSEITDDLAAGKLADLGSSMHPDAERIAAARPDALLVSPFENSGHGPLEPLGVPLVECADYMERSALGRAEWMRFFGLLFGCEERADSLLRAVRSSYDSLRTAAADVAERPTLLCDLKQGSTWYVPGGESYLGRLYADAGAHYLFADQTVSGSAALSPEAVFARASQADFWLVKYGAQRDLTYAQLAADDALYRQFGPWQRRRIYGCNTYAVPYYEEAPFHPDLLLRDLIRIFHPALLPGHRLRYFTPLQGDEAR